jgi:mono/diheme cytochrome c family protein
MTIFTPARVAVLAIGLGLLGGQALADASGQSSISTAANDQNASEPTTIKVPARFDFYKKQGLPAAYRGKTNPYQATVPVVLKGADRYNALCSSCHGLMGFGNGQASGALHPKPADLAWSLSDPGIKDDYLFWTIAEGGAQFGSKMPAFKKPTLTDEQIWQIIIYMRAAFEGREARATPPRPTRQAMSDVAHKTD